MNFDRIAPWYRSLEWIVFGDKLQRCRIASLAEIGAPRRVLIVGEGDGRFLAEFLRVHPDAEVDCLDASVRQWRARKRDVEGSIELDVTRISPLSGDEPHVLDAAHGTADMRRHRN